MPVMNCVLQINCTYTKAWFCLGKILIYTWLIIILIEINNTSPTPIHCCILEWLALEDFNCALYMHVQVYG